MLPLELGKNIVSLYEKKMQSFTLLVKMRIWNCLTNKIKLITYENSTVRKGYLTLSTTQSLASYYINKQHTKNEYSFTFKILKH